MWEGGVHKKHLFERFATCIQGKRRNSPSFSPPGQKAGGLWTFHSTCEHDNQTSSKSRAQKSHFLGAPRSSKVQYKSYASAESASEGNLAFRVWYLRKHTENLAFIFSTRSKSYEGCTLHCTCAHENQLHQNHALKKDTFWVCPQLKSR